MGRNGRIRNAESVTEPDGADREDVEVGVAEVIPTR